MYFCGSSVYCLHHAERHGRTGSKTHFRLRISPFGLVERAMLVRFFHLRPPKKERGGVSAFDEMSGKPFERATILRRSVKDALQERLSGRFEFYAEYLDTSRFPGESHHRLFRPIPAREICAASPRPAHRILFAETLSWLKHWRGSLFPDLPLVAVGTRWRRRGSARAPGRQRHRGGRPR